MLNSLVAPLLLDLSRIFTNSKPLFFSKYMCLVCYLHNMVRETKTNTTIVDDIDDKLGNGRGIDVKMIGECI